MMRFDLLSKVPISRGSAPITSLEAEQRINKSGKRASDQHKVLNVVKTYPGHTSRELHEYFLKNDIERHGVSSRLSELKDTHVTQGEKRKCQIANTNAVTWYPK